MAVSLEETPANAGVSPGVCCYLSLVSTREPQPDTLVATATHQPQSSSRRARTAKQQHMGGVASSLENGNSRNDLEFL